MRCSSVHPYEPPHVLPLRRMGAETHGARLSVVATQFRVHGVKGLRVCDATMFLEIVGVHTMALTVMVAEKCADLLKEAR